MRATTTSSECRSFVGEFQGYAANYMGKHGWKLESTHDYQDCMQEAWMVFNKVSQRYPDVEPRHLMALYKSSLTRHVINLAHTAEQVRRQGTALDATHTTQMVGETDNAGYLKRLCSQAPQEVKMVLSLFLSAPTELLESAFNAWGAHGHRMAGGNEHVSRLLGLPEGSKPVDAVRDYFS